MYKRFGVVKLVCPKSKAFEEHTHKSTQLSKWRRIHFPNMSFLISVDINAGMKAFVEFHSHTKEDGFPMIRSYLEYPMRAHNAIE